VLVCSRVSLVAGLLTIILAALVGVIYGGISGYIGGLTDEAMMRISEMVMAFPGIILAMTIATAVLIDLLADTLRGDVKSNRQKMFKILM